MVMPADTVTHVILDHTVRIVHKIAHLMELALDTDVAIFCMDLGFVIVLRAGLVCLVHSCFKLVRQILTVETLSNCSVLRGCASVRLVGQMIIARFLVLQDTIAQRR
jgi:hypothetical protein